MAPLAALNRSVSSLTLLSFSGFGIPPPDGKRKTPPPQTAEACEAVASPARRRAGMLPFASAGTPDGDCACAPAVCGSSRVRAGPNRRQRALGLVRQHRRLHRAQPGTAAPSATSRTRVVSIRIPGPMVLDTVTVFRYRPLAVDGLARRISSTTDR